MSLIWSKKARGNASFLCLRALIRLLPNCFTRTLFAWLGVLGGKIAKREWAIAEAQLRYVYGEVPENMPKAVFAHTGTALWEAINIEHFLETDSGSTADDVTFKRIKWEGIHPPTELHKQGKTIVALSGHTGCFEILAAYGARCGVPVYVIGRDSNSESLQAMLTTLRAAYGVKTLWRNDPLAIHRLRRILQKQVILGVLIDQDTKLDSEYATFFGLDAASPITPIRLAVRMNLPILTSFIFRTGKDQHTLYSEYLSYNPDDPNVNVNVLTVFNQRLEAFVKQYPEQWLWFHRRWRRRPEIDYKAHPEKLPGTKEYVAWLNQLAVNKRLN